MMLPEWISPQIHVQAFSSQTTQLLSFRAPSALSAPVFTHNVLEGTQQGVVLMIGQVSRFSMKKLPWLTLVLRSWSGLRCFYDSDGTGTRPALHIAVNTTVTFCLGPHALGPGTGLRDRRWVLQGSSSRGIFRKHTLSSESGSYYMEACFLFKCCTCECQKGLPS